MKYSKYSVVIIGSGAAGLYLALKVAEQKHLTDGILVITKSAPSICNSALAQGGIVAVLPEFNKNDSVSLHISDTIKAGAGLNDFNTVKHISQISSFVIQDLIKTGVEFDKDENGKLSFTLEAAHSTPRILHVKDATGKAIEDVLVKKAIESDVIDIYENTMALELLVDKEKTVRGVVVYNSETAAYEAVYSNNVVIATGGIGQIYKHTTNPEVTTGDGIALAYRAGARVKNMEFVQFHPSALAIRDASTMPLVSEAVRGAGAKLCDEQGNYFAKEYHEKGELAPRDVVSRAIYLEMLKNGTDNVFLDVSQMGLEFFRNRFPNITRICAQNNVDISDGLIPVAPAAHYFMGGIEVDISGCTSLKNLYAIGEASCSGFHGANRLASNSLLECVAGAYELADYFCTRNLGAPKNYDENVKAILDKYVKDADMQSDMEEPDIDDLKNKLREIMWENVGIMRQEDNLQYAKAKIERLEASLPQNSCNCVKEYAEFKNMLLVSKLIVQAAIDRKKSIGAHFRSDDIQGDVSIKHGAVKTEYEVKDNGSEIFAE